MKILLTHDGSEMADVAVPRVQALALAAGPQTEVVALCITPPETRAGSAEWTEAEQSLNLIKRALEASGVRSITVTITAGTPGPLITETAHHLDCDLIAMSTRGHSGHRQSLGSVTDYVVRHSDRIPVMLCRPEPAGRPLFQRILLPLDGSELNSRAIAQAQDLAKAAGASVVLLRLVDTIEQLRETRTPAGYALTPYLAADETLQRIIAAERDTAHRELDVDAAGLRAAGVADVEVQVVAGTPGVTIVETAEHLDCDVIVMSSHGRGRRGTTRLLGSVADHVLRHVANAALVIVPPAKADSRS